MGQDYKFEDGKAFFCVLECGLTFHAICVSVDAKRIEQISKGIIKLFDFAKDASGNHDQTNTHTPLLLPLNVTPNSDNIDYKRFL